MDTVYIHADESCLGNQNQNRARPGGAGGLMEVWADRQDRRAAAPGHDGREWFRRDYWISEGDTTNNRMALRSAIEPLRHLRRRCRVVFTSDSQYLVKGINEWRHSWKKRGWSKKGGAIKNLELWKRLDALVQRHELSARWVRGHDGHPENEYADFLATRAASDQTASGGLLPSGFQEWLDEEREKGRYLDYMEFQAPADRYPDYGLE